MMKSYGIFLLAAAAFFAPRSACAQNSGAPAPEFDRLLRTGALQEVLLHARNIPTSKDVGPLVEAKTLDPYIPGCGADEVLSLPPSYLKTYNVVPQDQRKLAKVMEAARKYSDVRKAFSDGYLPVNQYENGLGIAFAKSDLFTDRRYDLSKPDILFYIKERDRSVFRIVGTAFVAGDKTPSREFSVSRRKSRELPKLWKQWNDVCFKTEKGVLSYHDSEDDEGSCAGGKYVKRTWIMHVWLPLANPLGMFGSRNPAVDHLDLTGKPFPYCARTQ